jgi:hydrogenase maturation factor
MGGDPPPPCLTCADAAIPCRVVELREGGAARVAGPGGAVEDVDLTLVQASVGDVVLVHAGVAIGVLR